MEVDMIELVRKGIITKEQYCEAAARHRHEGGHLGVKLLELGYLDGEKMQRFARSILDN
jgi:hypothetical protein